MVISGPFVLRMGMFQREVEEEIKTHILCSVIFFFENRGVCKIMLKTIVELDRPQKTILDMRIAYRIAKGINTHSCM